MRLKYTRHARQRMARREINGLEIERILGEPEQTYDDPDEPNHKASVEGTVAGRRVRIVTNKGAERTIIVTVVDRDTRGAEA